MMRVTLNGRSETVDEAVTIAELLRRMELDPVRVAVEINEDVLPRKRFDDTTVREGDRIEVVTFVGGGCAQEAPEDRYRVGSFTFTSRLFVGTGKYANYDLMAAALAASECHVVTVAVRRDILAPDGRARPDNILDHLDLSRYTVLPNTAGCFDPKDAIRSARLSRELLEGLDNPGAKWVKLEVLADKKTLLPDPVGTLEACKDLVADGLEVLAYSNDDPILAKRLKEAGATSVMPLGSPIGSGQGVLNPANIRLCLEYLKDADPDYPVIVDAGVGTASDVTIAMELGADGVLLNTGIAGAKNPVRMARAMAHAVQAGRLAFLSGRIPRKPYATASSPSEGLIAPSAR